MAEEKKEFFSKKSTTTTLDKIISELPTSDMTQQIREMCDLIMFEEGGKMKYQKYAPKGICKVVCNYLTYHYHTRMY